MYVKTLLRGREPDSHGTKAHPGTQMQLPILAGTSYDGRHKRASWGMSGDGSAAALYATNLLIQVALRKES